MSEPTLSGVFVPCDRCDLGNIKTADGLDDQCPDCSSTLTRQATPAEVLSVLLPDVDWEALREAVDAPLWPRYPSDEERRSIYALTGTARRLLAVYDGKDG